MGTGRPATSWPSLARKMKACRRCQLAPGVRAVFEGSPGSRWMMVGQAPGHNENAVERPFVGSAGRRLFEWLAEAGFDEQEFRSRCYVTAVMLCFPGKGEHGDRRPTTRQLANCAPWLEQELAFIKPEVVMPVGQLAIERFLGKVPLADVIGRTFVRDVQGRRTRIIPLPHPSGASAWSFLPGNRRLLARAIRAIGRQR